MGVMTKGECTTTSSRLYECIEKREKVGGKKV